MMSKSASASGPNADRLPLNFSDTARLIMRGFTHVPIMQTLQHILTAPAAKTNYVDAVNKKVVRR
jgi:hypothetical protein